MKIVQGEDNSARWQDFLETFEDYALVDKLYKEAPKIQVAKFRVIFGDENRSVLRNLDVKTVENDSACEDGLSPCQQLRLVLDELSKRFKTHQNVIYQRFL